MHLSASSSPSADNQDSTDEQRRLTSSQPLSPPTSGSTDTQPPDTCTPLPPTPVVTENPQEQIIHKFAAYNRYVQTLLDEQPLAEDILQDILQQVFSNSTAPIDPDEIYVTGYYEQVEVNTANLRLDELGKPIRMRSTASKTLTQVLQEQRERGQLEMPDGTETNTRYGYFSKPNTVAHADELTVDPVHHFNTKTMEKLTTELKIKITLYWNTVDGTGWSKKDLLTENYKSILKAQANLRFTDRTLVAACTAEQNRQSDNTANKLLIDTVLALSTSESRATLPDADRPGVYKVSIEVPAALPKTRLAGAFIITSHHCSQTPHRHANGNVMTCGMSGPVILHTLDKGFEPFTSLTQLNDELDRRANDSSAEGQLLRLGLPTHVQTTLAQDRLNARVCTRLELEPVTGDLIAENIQSFLNLQQQNIAFAINASSPTEHLKSYIDALNDASNLDQQLDINNAFITCKQLLIQKTDNDNKPAWLKNASVEDQATYQQLNADETANAEDLALELEHIPSLATYSQETVSTYLKKTYPTVTIDPNKITVTITTTYKTLSSQPHDRQLVRRHIGYMTESTHYTEHTTSLTEYFSGNYATPWDDPIFSKDLTITASAPLVDVQCRPVVIGQDHAIVLNKSELDAMVMEVDIAEHYATLIKSTLSPFATSENARIMRAKWRTANEAKMRCEAFQVALQLKVSQTHLARAEGPAAAFFTTRAAGSTGNAGAMRGPQWIDTVVNHAEPSTRPTVEGHHIEANLLSLGSVPANRGQGGAMTFRGVIVIKQKDVAPPTSVVLYTPDAPDGQPYRELPSGVIDIDKLLAIPEWKLYFINRMASNDTEEKNKLIDSRINSIRGGGITYSTEPILGNLQDALYTAHAGFILAHADYHTTSNAEITRQSTFNKVMFGLDIVDMLLDIIPGKVALSIVRKGIKKLAHGARHNLPNVIKQTNPAGQSSLTIGKTSVKSLEPNWVNLSNYRLSTPVNALFDVDGFAKTHHFKVRHSTGSATYFIDKSGNHFVVMAKQGSVGPSYSLYPSYVENGARYVKDPTSIKPDFRIVPDDENRKIWKPRFDRTTWGGIPTKRGRKVTVEMIKEWQAITSKDKTKQSLAALHEFATGHGIGKATISQCVTVKGALTPKGKTLFAEATGKKFRHHTVQDLKDWRDMPQVDRQKTSPHQFAIDRSIHYTEFSRDITTSGELRWIGQHKVDKAEGRKFHAPTAEELIEWRDMSEAQNAPLSWHQFARDRNINPMSFNRRIKKKGGLNLLGEHAIEGSPSSRYITAQDLMDWRDLADVDRVKTTRDEFALSRNINPLTFSTEIETTGALRPRGIMRLNRASGIKYHEITVEELIEWRDMPMAERTDTSWHKFALEHQIEVYNFLYYAKINGELTSLGKAKIENAVVRFKPLTAQDLKDWRDMPAPERKKTTRLEFAKSRGLNPRLLARETKVTGELGPLGQYRLNKADGIKYHEPTPEELVEWRDMPENIRNVTPWHVFAQERKIKPLSFLQSAATNGKLSDAAEFMIKFANRQNTPAGRLDPDIQVTDPAPQQRPPIERDTPPVLEKADDFPVRKIEDGAHIEMPTLEPQGPPGKRIKIDTNTTMTLANAKIHIANRAMTLQSQLPSFAKNRTTLAAGILRNNEGEQITVIATSAKRDYLHKNTILNPQEIVIRGQGHAEVKILAWASQYGYTVETIAAGRPICLNCSKAMNDAGTVPATALKKA